MNNLSKIFMGVAALAMFSCSNDEPAIDGADDVVNGGNLAYMNIRLQDAGARGGRSTTDGGLEFGNADEHAISGVQFFFFESNGAYCGKATPWADGYDGDKDDNPNVEFKGNAVIVLDKVTSKASPSYILTVLNAPSFTAEGTLELTAEKLQNWAEGNYFVMSTSSYNGTDVHHNDAYYYATAIQESDFTTTPEEAKKLKPVDIYVERLAAKIELTTDKNLASVTIDGKEYFKLDVSVMGNDNGSLDQDDNRPTGATDVYIKFNGWGLTNTTNTSYISKHIGEWKGANLFGDWNDATNFRSYWGKSIIYGGFDQAKVSATTFPALSNKINEDFAYCNENTMPEYTSPLTQATTVLVSAQICDENGNALDLVRYHGLLFNKTDFFKYVLNSANAEGKLNYYVKTTTDGEDAEVVTYAQADFSWFEFALAKPEGKSATGEVVVELNSVTLPELAADQVFCQKNADGTYTEIELTAETVKTALDEFVAGFKAEAFTGGNMFYAIPVEHLTASVSNEKSDEGYYGVVRNHWYRLAINKIEKLGQGVFDPDGDEEITPKDEDDEYYYLGATINILSWKIVNQGVEL